MLSLMAHKTDLATIGHIFLTLGIFGYYTDNTYLGYIGLALALLCYARQLLSNYRNNPIETTEKNKTEEQPYPPIQTVSPYSTSDITITTKGGSS